MRNKITKIRYALVSLIILAVLLVGTSCAYFGPVSPSISGQTPVSSPTDSPSVQQLVNETPALLLPDFVSVVAKVRPSVVAITTRFTVLGFFGRTFTQEGAGSGWIIRQDGLIVTNNHVVEDADSITVTLEDGRSFPAEVVRTDRVADLAIVKISAHNLPVLEIGDSSRL